MNITKSTGRWDYLKQQSYTYYDVHELLDACIADVDPKKIELLKAVIKAGNKSPIVDERFIKTRKTYYEIINSIEDENGLFDRNNFLLSAMNHGLMTVDTNHDFGMMIIHGEIERVTDYKYRLTGGSKK